MCSPLDRGDWRPSLGSARFSNSPPLTDLEASLKTLHLVEPFRIAHGTSATRQVLRVTENGHTAEAPFVPYYEEDPETTLAALNQAVLPQPLPRTAMLALNLLKHDIVGHATGRSLTDVAASHLVELPRKRLPPGCRSFGIPLDLDIFDQRVREVSQQFRVLKLKLGSGDLGLDVATASVARNAAPDADLIFDVNGGWDPMEAPLMIEKLSYYNPVLIEQPIHHNHGPEAWEELRANLPGNVPPIYADESVQTAEDIPDLAPWVDGVNLKLLKCGSFDAALAFLKRARKLNLQVMLGCMVESSLGTTAAAHLAPWADWIDLDGHLSLTNDDFVGITYDARGNLILPRRAGIGAVPRA